MQRDASYFVVEGHGIVLEMALFPLPKKRWKSSLILLHFIATKNVRLKVDGAHHL